MKKFLRHFSWIFTVPLFFVIGIFAVANREGVALNFWPFDFTFNIPASFLMLGSVFTGFVIGGLVTWSSAGRQRRKARAARNRVTQLEREVQILRAEKAQAESKASAAAAAADRGEPALLQRPSSPGQPAA